MLASITRCAVVLSLVHLPPASPYRTTCSLLDNYPQLDKNTILTDASFWVINSVSLLTCVKQCKMHRRCESFNFELILGKCSLNEKSRDDDSHFMSVTDSVFSDIHDWPELISGACAHHNCSNTSVCEPVSGNGYACYTIYCTDPPVVEDASIVDEKRYWKINDTVGYTCKRGFEPAGVRVCQENGTWTDFQCMRIATCKDLKSCNAEHGDGEYWIRPVKTNRNLLKVYCYKMHTASPVAFITLNGDTYSYFLDSDIETCGPFWRGMHAGITKFQKVKLNVWEFTIMHGIFTFATTNGTFGPLGRAGDCRLKTSCAADQVGSFRIDLTGTGLKLESGATWDNDTTITKFNNGSIVEGECMGECKMCLGQAPVYYNGMFKVEYDSTSTPDSETARYPECKL